MKKSLLVIALMFCFIGQAQMTKPSEIKMDSRYLSENEDVSDLLFFQGIDFHKIQFNGEDLKGATFKLIAKEFWNGKLKNETIVTNSATIDIPEFAQIQEEVFNMKVISKLTEDNKLKMSFKFPRYGRELEYKAIASDDYSLRNVASYSKEPILIDDTFYLFAYILPYEKDGAKYWCAVENSGKDIENWGKEFGIKHYLVFEMRFESPKDKKITKQ